jgi:hypothetical protein
MTRRTVLAIVLLLVLLAALAGSVLAQDNAGDSIGRPLWRMKCSHEASVIVETMPDGTNVVTCFLYW